MTDGEVAKKAASFLRAGDAVKVVVGYDRMSRLCWTVRIDCNRQAFPSHFVRGGFSSEVFVGRCRSEGSATRRANRVLDALHRARGSR